MGIRLPLDYRRFVPLAIALAITALYFLAGAIHWITEESFGPRNEWPIIACIGLLLALWSLCTTWTALGDGWWLTRTSVLLVALLGVPWFFEALVGPGPAPGFIIVIGMAYCACVFVPVLLARLWGICWRLEGGESAATLQARQFSIRQILAVTVVVAVLMAVVRLLDLPDSIQEIGEMALIFLTPVTITFTAIPLVFRASYAVAGVTLVILSLVLGSIVTSLQQGPDREEVIVFFLLQAVVLFIALATLRLCGYRLVSPEAVSPEA